MRSLHVKWEYREPPTAESLAEEQRRAQRGCDRYFKPVIVLA